VPKTETYPSDCDEDLDRRTAVDINFLTYGLGRVLVRVSEGSKHIVGARS
jgi:hypothetical protein